MPLFFSAVFTVARTQILQYTLALMYIVFYININKNNFKEGFSRLNVKKAYRKVVFISVILLVSFIFIAEYTGKIGAVNLLNKDFFVYKYLGYSLVAFDKYILDYPAVTKGYFISGPVGKILYKFNNSSVEIGAPMGEFNVYSFLSGPYLDFGILGVIISMFIVGCFVAVVYSKSQLKGGAWTIFYANYLYVIMVSFFAYQFSNTFYIYLIITLIFIGCKFNILKNKA